MQKAQHLKKKKDEAGQELPEFCFILLVKQSTIHPKQGFYCKQAGFIPAKFKSVFSI